MGTRRPLAGSARGTTRDVKSTHSSQGGITCPRDAGRGQLTDDTEWQQRLADLYLGAWVRDERVAQPAGLSHGMG